MSSDWLHAEIRITRVSSEQFSKQDWRWFCLRAGVFFPSVSWFCFSIINSGSCCSLPPPDTGLGSVRWCSCAYAQLLGMERHDGWASETTDSLTRSLGAVKWWDLCRPSEWLGSVPHQVKYMTRPVSYTHWFMSLFFMHSSTQQQQNTIG